MRVSVALLLLTFCSSPVFADPGSSDETTIATAAEFWQLRDSRAASGELPNRAAHLAGAKQAKESFERGDLREAERLFQAILDEVPDNLYVLSNLGVTRFRAGKLKLAANAFRRAIAIAPTDDFSHCALGITYFSQGRYDDAVIALTKAIAINPKNRTAHRYLGLVACEKLK